MERREPRLEACQLVVEDVQIARRIEPEGAIAMGLKPTRSQSASSRTVHGRLAPARMEGRIDIDQVDTVVRAPAKTSRLSASTIRPSASVMLRRNAVTDGRTASNTCRSSRPPGCSSPAR